jgi:Leucine-rich repeat (LRR) protein
MEILRQNNYDIVHLTDGKLILEAVKLINDQKADGINFNFTKNFPADINEIKLAADIKYIQINDYTWDFDYSAVNYLSKLEHLSVYTTDKKEINFSNWPLLKSTALYWRPKANSLFKCLNLERLFIGKYSGPDLSKFEFLENLKYLRINTGSVKSLKGIEKLQHLETLLLMQATKLEDLTGIDKLPNLKQLRIDNCRNIKNIDIVADLKDIKMEIRGTTPKLR